MSSSNRVPGWCIVQYPSQGLQEGWRLCCLASCSNGVNSNTWQLSYMATSPHQPTAARQRSAKSILCEGAEFQSPSCAERRIVNGLFFQFQFVVAPPPSVNVTTIAPTPCDLYIKLTDSWRNFAYTLGSHSNYDSALVNQWIRFTGIGGDRIVNTCHCTSCGGTVYTVHVPFTYPNASHTTATGTAHVYYSTCQYFSLAMEVMYCPDGFFIYKSAALPVGSSGFVTYHHVCTASSCGPLAECTEAGGCVCIPGYRLDSKTEPTPDSYGCLEIDECTETPTICGSNSECVNEPGSYYCLCLTGYQPTNTSLEPSGSNPCIDINECLEPVCGAYGDCSNTVGSFICTCHLGFELIRKGKPPCQDIDECLEEGLCGPNSICTNTLGGYNCSCEIGYIPTNEAKAPSQTNICIDLDECERLSTVVDPIKKYVETVCGPSCNCTNTIGSYYCTCFSGYRLGNQNKIASRSNPCLDIDECVETPGICGPETICTNYPGTFYCSCPEGYYPNTGLYWTVGITFCENVQLMLTQLQPPKGKTKEGVFFDKIDQQLNNLTEIPTPTIANSFSASMEVAGVGPRARSSRVSSSGNGEVGSVILELCDRLVATIVPDNYNQTNLNVKNSAVDLSLESYGYSGNNMKMPPLGANGNSMEINMEELAENNNGSAAAAFLTLNGMESLLSHQYLKTENRTEMISDVITAILPKMNNTNITDPVNFTIQHKKSMYEAGMITCVYWKTEKDEYGLVTFMGWSTEGCTMTFSNENYTTCSCSHLSTFALILQIADPPPQNDFLDWLNRICVIIGLFFFALAVLTFLLCSWNPKINNTARLHLCLNLGLSHLLMLWNDRYLDDELACTVMAGLLHFLIVASFVWMLLEATQLFMLVRKLTKVQVIKRDGLPKPVLYIVGYGVPLIVVGVSALVYSDGYGATGDACWLSTTRNFNWALTGPVVAILAFNCTLFGATLWSLRTTLANMKSGASDSKDARLVLFKIVAQFVILGCTWILGLYQSNLFFQVLFIILNSQQGTFLFIVHCVLNKEIREEYIKWLNCSFKNKEVDDEVKDVPSVSEDMDKTK
ncbi:adhesion G protein-coupled receptor E2-like [Periophthalmus magnuspinnatus]|uniref:adhesion G protein-coupled receptor E2-like n=1 Tax=Periophthalmus magnuspinnatus TaxID=409849 RepID=UPI002437161C|nr:adhesion G protein-coupled receptor E2-like [Periophthalmus magnuspinnatus]